MFLMGCYDNNRDRWVTVTKCHCGFDDKTLDKLQKPLEANMEKISQDKTKIPDWLHMNKAITPDYVTVNPKVCNVSFHQENLHCRIENKTGPNSVLLQTFSQGCSIFNSMNSLFSESISLGDHGSRIQQVGISHGRRHFHPLSQDDENEGRQGLDQSYGSQQAQGTVLDCVFVLSSP